MAYKWHIKGHLQLVEKDLTGLNRSTFGVYCCLRVFAGENTIKYDKIPPLFEVVCKKA